MVLNHINLKPMMLSLLYIFFLITCASRKVFLLDQMAWTSANVSTYQWCPTIHPCCDTILAHSQSAPMKIELFRGAQSSFSFRLEHNGTNVSIPAYSSGTYPGQFDATNIPPTVLQQLYSNHSLCLNRSVPWRLFLNEYPIHGRTWVAWTSLTPDGDECVLST